MVPELEKETYKVYASAPARIYHANLHTTPTAWAYTGLRGTLVFGWDAIADDRPKVLKKPNKQQMAINWETTSASRERYWFRLIDHGADSVQEFDETKNTGRTIWIYRIPEAPYRFDYHVDRPFFHVFAGRTRMWGLLFEEDEEASEVADQVWARTTMEGKDGHPQNTITKHAPITRGTSSSTTCKPFKSPAKHPKLPPRNSNSKSSKLSLVLKSQSQKPRREGLSSRAETSMISAPVPGSLVHMSHLGVSKQGVLEATEDLHPSWASMLAIWREHGHGMIASTSPEAGYEGGTSLRKGTRLPDS